MKGLSAIHWLYVLHNEPMMFKSAYVWFFIWSQLWENFQEPGLFPEFFYVNGKIEKVQTKSLAVGTEKSQRSY